MTVDTDAFTYSDGELESVSSGAWLAKFSAGSSTINVDTNKAKKGSGANNAPYIYNATYASENVYSQWVFDTLGSGWEMGGVLNLGGGSAGNEDLYYAILYDAGGGSVDCYVSKRVGGSTQVGSTVHPTVNTSSVGKFTHESGDALKIYVDSSDTGAGGTDSTLSHATSGVYIDAGASSAWRLDDWEGGDFAAAGATSTIAATAQAATAALNATQAQTASITATLQQLSAALTGTMLPAGAIATALQAATAALTATHEQSTTVAGTLQPATAALLASQEQTATVAATLQPATASATATMQPSATIAATLQPATASLTATHEQTSAIAATMQSATASLSASTTADVDGTIAGTLQAATAALSGVMHPASTVAANLQPATAALAADEEVANPASTIAGTLQPATAALAATQTLIAAIAVSLQVATAAAVGVHGQTAAIAATLQIITAALSAQQTIPGADPRGIAMVGSVPVTPALTGYVNYASVGSVPQQALTGVEDDG